MTPTASLRNATLLAISLLALAACGDNSQGGSVPVRCESGFELVGDECVPGRDIGGEITEDVVEDDVPSEDTGSDGPSVLDLGNRDTGACNEGQVGCSPLGVPQECVSGTWVDQDACPAAQVCVGGRCVPGADCDPGTVIGCWDQTSQRVCNDAGSNYEQRDCEDGLFCFRGECGTQICEPDSRSCDEDGRFVQICAGTGEEWLRSEECNPRDDLVCVGGECVSGCAAALKDPTYIGCEYWSVDLPQYQDPFGDPRMIRHAVVVANTGDRPAEVIVETRSGLDLIDSAVTVEPGTVRELLFPIANVEDTARSMNSFRISTSEPVVAYQFNPLNDVGVASNDASLLLPANAIGREYYVMSWPSGVGAMGFAPQTGWFTIVGTTEEPTTVDITFSAPLIDGTDPDLIGVEAGDTVRFSLEQYEVINFEAESTLFNVGDLTGTHIEADRPIAVFGGHEEAVIGEEEPGGGGPCCADHMEQQLFPVATWGTRYPAVHSPPRGTEPDVWRVLAARDGTRITTIPPIPGLDGITLNAGEFAEANVVESFEVIGSEPILVAHFLVSQLDYRIPRTKGDPAMVLAVAAEQFRSDYMVLTPQDYSEDWITVIRPAGAPVTLDGELIPDGEFTAFGTNEYEFSHRAVEPGPHILVSPTEERFGIAAFGYNSAVSYGYPGGLNLATEFEVSDP